MDNTQTKPSLIMVIGLMTLVNGIFNIIWGISIIVGTGFLAFICAAPIPLFPIILGGFEIAYAIKLLANPPQPVQPSQAIAIWEIIAIFVGNVFSLIVGILALVFYNDTVVRDYFAQLNNPPRSASRTRTDTHPCALASHGPRTAFPASGRIQARGA